MLQNIELSRDLTIRVEHIGCFGALIMFVRKPERGWRLGGSFYPWKPPKWSVWKSTHKNTGTFGWLHYLVVVDERGNQGDVCLKTMKHHSGILHRFFSDFFIYIYLIFFFFFFFGGGGGGGEAVLTAAAWLWRVLKHSNNEAHTVAASRWFHSLAVRTEIWVLWSVKSVIWYLVW